MSICQCVQPVSCDRRRRSGGANGIPRPAHSHETPGRRGKCSPTANEIRRHAFGARRFPGDLTLDSRELEDPPGRGRAAAAARGARRPHGPADRAGRLPGVPGRRVRARGHPVRLPRHRPRPLLRGERGDPADRRRLAAAGARRRRQRVRRREERDAHGPRATRSWASPPSSSRTRSRRSLAARWARRRSSPSGRWTARSAPPWPPAGTPTRSSWPAPTAAAPRT